MRNRAKCALCENVIEVGYLQQYTSCSCGEITIGPDLYAQANDFDNFLRVDDEGNEKAVQYQDKNRDEDEEVDSEEEAHTKPTTDELLSMLDSMIEVYETLPQRAMQAPVTHADHLSLLMLVSSLFKSISAS